MKASELTDADKSNFRTLLRAAKDDRLCVVSCIDRELHTSVPVLCAVNIHHGRDEPYQLVPLGTAIRTVVTFRPVP